MGSVLHPIKHGGEHRDGLEDGKALKGWKSVTRVMVTSGERTYNIVVCLDCGLGFCCLEGKVEVDEDAPFTFRRIVLSEEHVLGRDVPVEYPNVVSDEPLVG
jgi:hypothetical protein